MKKELNEASAEFGDARRSPIVEREEAKAISKESLIVVESVTVVLSQKGWIRSAKGHEVDPTSLNYKTGDEFLSASKGKSNQNVYLLDYTGRTYAVQAHTLPSVRGQGEPITGRLNVPSGATFCGTLMGADDEKVLLSTDAGYGFVAKLGDLYSKNKAGKANLSVPKGGKVLAPRTVNSYETDMVASISNDGKMLVFPLRDLPELAKGKGNKIMNIPSAKLKERLEWMAHSIVIPEGKNLIVFAGKRHTTIKFKELEHYMGERGRRGNKLPRGLQRVEKVEIEE